MQNASLMLFGTQEKCGQRFHWNIKSIIIVVPFTGEIVLVTKIVLERQFVMPKFDGMNVKIRIANWNQLSI